MSDGQQVLILGGGLAASPLLLHWQQKRQVWISRCWRRIPFDPEPPTPWTPVAQRSTSTPLSFEALGRLVCAGVTYRCDRRYPCISPRAFRQRADDGRRARRAGTGLCGGEPRAGTGTAGARRTIGCDRPRACPLCFAGGGCREAGCVDRRGRATYCRSGAARGGGCHRMV